jgi:hypothetical protein
MKSEFLFVVLLILGPVACAPSNLDAESIEASLADTARDPLVFYATHSPKTDPGEHAHLLEGVSEDVAGIVRAVQGVLVHGEELEKRGYPISRSRADREVDIGTVRGMLDRIADLDGRPLVERRPPEKRLVGVCSHFALLTTALLRHHGVPARTRGGFEAYVSESAHHDHWITEYWSAVETRWVRVDPEINQYFRRIWGIEFDSLDVPEELFITGAEAWRLCRAGDKQAEQFGIWGGEWIGGWSFVLNGLILDFNALNKVESLPWDGSPLIERGFDRLTEDELALLDSVAKVAVEEDAPFDRVRELFGREPSLRK